MSIRRRRRNRGKQRARVARTAVPPRVRPDPVEIPAAAPASPAYVRTPPDTAVQGPDYAYVKRDMIWMLAVSAVLFGAMIVLALFL